jgi:hypothetical protein
MPESKRKQVRIPAHTPEPEYAKELGLAEETLQKKRRRGETSDYIVIGRMVHYVDADKQPWLERLRKAPVRSGHSHAQSRYGHAANPQRAA